MNRKNYNILSLNGGGIKGLKVLVQLIELEEKLDGSLLNYFDMIAGTSVGAIIGAMLAKGYTAKQIYSIFKEAGPGIFKKRFLSSVRNPRYKDDYVNKILFKYLGDIQMVELKCDILILAYNGTTRDFTFFKNNGKTKNVLVRDAVRASMSAQVYFKPFELNGNIYIDGGNGLNNPSIDALQEASDLCDGKKINLLNFGTGKSEKPLKINQNIIQWLITSVELNMTEAEQLTQKRVAYSFDKKVNPLYNKYTYCDSPLYYSSAEMDDASPKNIENLVRDGRLAYKGNELEINSFVNEIKSL